MSISIPEWNIDLSAKDWIHHENMAHLLIQNPEILRVLNRRVIPTSCLVTSFSWKVSQSNMYEVMRSRDKEMKRADKSLFQDGQIGRNPHKLFNFKWNRFDNFSWIDASCIRGKNHFQASKYHKAGIRGRRTEVSGLENGWRRGQHQAVPPLLAGNQQIWHALVRYRFCFTFNCTRSLCCRYEVRPTGPKHRQRFLCEV